MRKKCTSEQIAEARRMNARRIPWATIGATFGVSGEIIRRYAQRGYRESIKDRPSASWGNRNGAKWSDEDAAKLVQLRAENVGWNLIAERFGRSKQACQVKHHEEMYRTQRLSVSRDKVRLARKPSGPSRTDLTGIICGDPAPGRSALEQMPRRRRPISLAPISMGASA